MNSQNGTNGTPPSCSRAARVKRGMAYGARALGSRSFHSSLRTGKPSTRAQRSKRSPPAKGSRFPHGQDVEVREMRTAETIRNMLQDRGRTSTAIGQSLGNKETREPCAMKVARTVWRGTGGKGRAI